MALQTRKRQHQVQWMSFSDMPACDSPPSIVVAGGGGGGSGVAGACGLVFLPLFDSRLAFEVCFCCPRDTLVLVPVDWF
jgi:hypothetical protein